MDLVESEAVKSKKFIYDNTCSVLDTFRMLARVAEMLGAPDGLEGVRELMREYEDVAPDGLKPSKYGLVGEYGEKALRVWLLTLAYSEVLWMDDQFHIVHTTRHIARYGRTSRVRYDPSVF